MTFAVRDICDQIFRLVQRMQDSLHDFQVRPLIVAANVIDFSDFAFADNQINCCTVIMNMEPVPDVFPGSIDRNGLIIQGTEMISGISFSGK